MKLLRKNGWKLALDLVMAVVLILMYNKRVLGMSFHEIGGLAVCGLFVIHKLLNRRWIKAVTVGLFSSHTPVRQKLLWWVDLLLFGCFVTILISGILISKVVFPSGEGGASAKMLHYAVAALALMLTGVHVGLHMGWIGQRMPFFKKMPLWLRRGLAVALSAAVLVFGAAQFSSTNMIRWLGSLGTAFGASQQPAQGAGERVDSEGNVVFPTLDELSAEQAESADSSALSDTESSAQTSADTVSVTVSETGEGQGRGSGGGNGSGLRDGQGPHGSGEGGSTASIVDVLLSFMSILLAFAAATAWIDGGLMFRRRKRLLKLTVKPTVQP